MRGVFYQFFRSCFFCFMQGVAAVSGLLVTLLGCLCRACFCLFSYDNTTFSCLPQTRLFSIHTYYCVCYVTPFWFSRSRRVSFVLSPRCCCACWDSFAFWMDQRNTQNNLPVFRLLYFSSTVVYFIVMLGVAAGGIKRWVTSLPLCIVISLFAARYVVPVELERARRRTGNVKTQNEK